MHQACRFSPSTSKTPDSFGVDSDCPISLDAQNFKTHKNMMATMDDHSGFLLLDDGQVSLIAEILSYILESTQDLARLRRVSKRWNSSVLPYCIRNGCFLKNCCAFPQSPEFVEELVKVGEGSYAGRLYCFPPSEPGDTGIFDFWVQNSGTSPAPVATDAMLMISDYDYGKGRVVPAPEKQEDYSFVNSERQHRTFAEYCKTLTETKSWDTFQSTGKKAVDEGMFVCIEDLEKAKRESLLITLVDGEAGNGCIPVILTVKVPRDHIQVVESGSDHDDRFKIALLKTKSPRDDGEDEVFPFVNDETKNNSALEKEEGEEDFLYPTLAGYNVTEEDGLVTCQVPTAFPLNYDLEMFLYDEDTESHLPLDALWSKCQERHVREGVAIADGVVPKDLNDRLMSQIDAFVENQAIVDYHPHSNDIVRDIVHPAIYSYVKGVSPLLKSEEEIRSLPSAIGTPIEKRSPGLDYWGRPYEASPKYQWLPTYFDIGIDGNCTVCDYINNIVPRDEQEELYASLGQLFSQALPLIESVYGYCRVVKEHHLRSVEEDEDYDNWTEQEIVEVPVSLRGKQVQVVTKIVDYELSPGQTYEGVWHVEGMSHEEIVATAIYFIDRDEEIEGGNILFKRAFHKREAKHIYFRVDQSRPDMLQSIIDDGLHPLGQVETISGRLLVFPNSHVHKVTKLENVLPAADGDGTTKKKRRIIVFFLINPEQRIVSTREVPVQQEHAGGSMTWAEACEHRLELMKERKYTKQDWNVREIELCEH
eukprot:scaffold6651_cov99-Cylindrotheca_fusiformis.AAC.5